jgi:F0F1-type ATP synthase membrane subunit c/vacuolar-type H+-ATPase subunit K
MSLGTVLVVIGAGLAVGLSAIGAGIGVGIAGAAGAGVTAVREDKFGVALVFQALPQTQGIYGLLIAILLLMSTGLLGGEGVEIPIPVGLAAIGVGFAVGISGLSAIGQGIAASSGVAVAGTERGSIGRNMVFSVLPETQAIYGLLIAILLMAYTGMFTGVLDIPAGIGIAAIGCGLAVGIAGLSAVGQGIAAGAGIGATSENEEMFGKGLVFSVLPETQAIYGLLVAILIMAFTGMFTGVFSATPEIGIVAIGCGLAVGLAGLSGIGQGIAASSGIGATAMNEESFGKGLVFSVLPETQAIYGLLVAILLMAFTGMFTGAISVPAGVALAAVGCGCAIGFAGLSGIGQGIAASSGIGATAENEEIFGKGLVFSVLPETQAIYGLLVAILLMAFTGMFTGIFSASVAVGVAAVGSGLAVGIAGFSGIGQGITAGAGISATLRRPEVMGKALIFAVMSETFAIFGLLVAILIMYGIGLVGT